MWILIKLFIAVCGFLFRLIHGKFLVNFGEVVPGTPGLHKYESKSKNGSVMSTSFRIPATSKALFKITEETSWDQYFKRLGFSEELQVGDKEFDESYYIACDSPPFLQEIQQNGILREFIKNIFKFPCNSISSDGSNLWFRFEGKINESEEVVEEILGFEKEIQNLGQNNPWIWHDPFAWKVLLTECIIWSLASYAVAGFIEWSWFSEDLHLEKQEMLWQGLTWGAIGLAIILVLITLLFRKSSRGHRIIIESYFVLGLSFPMGGIHVVSDVNTQFDKSPPNIIKTELENVRQVQHRGRKGRTYYTYHMTIRPKSTFGGVLVPSNIQISREIFSRLQGRPPFVEIQIGKGFLGHPWYRSIEPTR